MEIVLAMTGGGRGERGASISTFNPFHGEVGAPQSGVLRKRKRKEEEKRGSSRAGIVMPLPIALTAI